MDRNFTIKANEIKSLANSNSPTSPTSSRKSVHIRNPFLKSYSSTKISNCGEEISEETLMRRRISKLTEKQFQVVLEKAIDILAKPSDKRNLEEIFHLIRATEKLDFFARMIKDKEMEFFSPSSMNFKCCKALKYEHFEKGETVFFQGDIGDKFYIIIKGKVSVLLHKESTVIEKEKEVLKNLRRNRVIPEYMKKYLEPPVINIKKEKENLPTVTKEKNTQNAIINPENKAKDDKTIMRMFTSGDRGDLKKKFQKGISKVSNALLFLKTIEKSSENSKTQASITAFSPINLKVPGDLSKDISHHEKEVESPVKTAGTVVIPLNNKKCLIPGLDNNDLKNKDLFFDNGVFKYNIVQNLKSGDVFGELAIIRKKKRAATIVCLESAHMAVLMKKDYESILLEQETAKFQKLVDFFNKTLFKRCSNDRMTFIAYMYQKKKYVKDQVIFKEGQEAIECFIVKKGDVELSKSIVDEQGKKTKEGKVVKSIKKGKVALLSCGQFFGEEEILKNLDSRKYTAKVISVKATLFSITKQNFKKMLNEYKDIAILFKQQVKSKESFHSTKLSQISNLLMVSKENKLASKAPKKKPRKTRAPLRATIDQLDLFLNENKRESFQQIPILAFQSNSTRSHKIPSAIRKVHEENVTEKKLYHQETHQFTKVVRANQLTLKALLKKKIDIFELYAETKNLHNPNDIKYMTKRERSKTQSTLIEPSIIHNVQTLQNIERKGDKTNDSLEFLNVFTPIRKLSNPEVITTVNSPIFKKTNFIKTYEYFCDPIKKKGPFIGKCNSCRTFSLNLRPEIMEDMNKPNAGGLCIRNHLGLNDLNWKSKNGSFPFLEDDPIRRGQSNSIVVLNHMGKPVKFSSN